MFAYVIVVDLLSLQVDAEPEHLNEGWFLSAPSHDDVHPLARTIEIGYHEAIIPGDRIVFVDSSPITQGDNPSNYQELAQVSNIVVKGEQGRKATVELVAQRGNSFAIDNIQYDQDCLRVHVKAIALGKRYSVTAFLSESLSLESLRSTIRIHTTDKLQPVIVLPVRFLVLHTPRSLDK